MYKSLLSLRVCLPVGWCSLSREVTLFYHFYICCVWNRKLFNKCLNVEENVKEKHEEDSILFFIEHQEASGKEYKSLWNLVSLFYDYNILWIQPDNPNQYCEFISEDKASLQCPCPSGNSGEYYFNCLLLVLVSLNAACSPDSKCSPIAYVQYVQKL